LDQSFAESENEHENARACIRRGDALDRWPSPAEYQCKGNDLERTGNDAQAEPWHPKGWLPSGRSILSRGISLGLRLSTQSGATEVQVRAVLA
jgi:hypothetical protein